MNSEYNYLVHLVKSAVSNTAANEKPKDVSFEAVLNLAKTHEVANYAYLSVQKLKEKPEESILSLWEQEYYKGIQRDTKQSLARESIVSALHKEKIYTLEVQGTVVKNYYPARHLRMMSDIDFIIPSDKLTVAQNVMQELGYHTEIKDGNEIHADKGNIFVELHTNFFGEIDVTNKVLKEPFTYANLSEDYTATLSDTDFYLFNILHAIKHLEYGGLGIRRIMDLYFLEKALKEKVDNEYIDSLLQENNLYTQKENLFSVMYHWFYSKTLNEDLVLLEEEIFSAGNHGTRDLYYKHRFAREKSQGKHFVKLRSFLENVFPSKEDIYNRYPFCKKHNLPIVLCWIHRLFCIVLNKDKWKNIKSVFNRIRKN